ncbi:MAG TPA: selenide, water dikinase SelD [Caulobacteraceae bacterium]|nr:selenide, water dikinase SelD [Caulobacteraceae bacterium]
MIRLTALAHGGGCGCKLSPKVLRDILAEAPACGTFANLLVGTETSDDAAAWRLNPDQAVVATTDFFTPIVDDPRDFGRIAATNALSDVYAMGATPIFALAIVGMPVAKIEPAMIRAILAGGAEAAAGAGIPIVGGHSIDAAEPIYGLAALGLVHPQRLMRNSTAKAGDVLILTKPLGVGVLAAALKQDRLDAEGYAALIAITTQLNRLGAELPAMAGVSAATDVTGFGLLGHALEMARGARLSLAIDLAALPIIPGVEAMLQAGLVTGASGRNWESLAEAVSAPSDLAAWRRDLLTDPQTSGGLLIAVAESGAEAALSAARAHGAHAAAVIGRFSAGPAEIRLAHRLTFWPGQGCGVAR